MIPVQHTITSCSPWGIPASHCAQAGRQLFNTSFYLHYLEEPMHYLLQPNSSVKQNWFPQWLRFCPFPTVPQFPANAEIYLPKGHLHNISFYLDKVQRLLPKAVRMQSSLGARLRNRGVNFSAYLAFQRAGFSLNKPQLQLWLLQRAKLVVQQNRTIREVVTQGSGALSDSPNIT